MNYWLMEMYKKEILSNRSLYVPVDWPFSHLRAGSFYSALLAECWKSRAESLQCLSIMRRDAEAVRCSQFAGCNRALGALGWCLKALKILYFGSGSGAMIDRFCIPYHE